MVDVRPPRSARPARRRAEPVLLATVHGVDDVYQGCVPALLPAFVAAGHWSYAQAGGLTLAATLLSSVVQPGFGILTDRRPLPWLVPAGMVLAAVGIGLSGLVSASYVAVLAVVALSGLGVAAFHPESARLARLASGGRHATMGWFSLGGNLGWAAAPLLVLPVLAGFGLGGTPLLVLPAVLAVVVLLAAVPAVRPTRAAARASTRTAADRGRDDVRSFALLTTAIVLRSVVAFALGSFLALYAQRELGPVGGQVALVLFYAGGALGTLAGGMLADRFPRVRIVRVAYVAAVPALVLLAVAPGPLLWAAAAVTGLALFVPFSLHVTLGQDYLPSRIGTASGVTLGLAVSLGGVAAPLLGALADRTSVALTIGVLAVFPALCAAVAAALREPRVGVPGR